MKTYYVMWEVSLDATSPREAAERARAIQRDLNARAGVFDVCGVNEGLFERIDLDELADSEDES